MLLLRFCQWCDESLVGNTIRDSQWLFAVIESVHLLALATIGGAVLLVDLRLLGIGLRQQRVSYLARAAFPWLAASLIVLLVTGGLLFTSEAVKCYNSFAFRYKMLSLLLAVVFTLTLRRKVTMTDEGFSRPMRALAAIVSLMLWSGVGIAGRWIGFS